MHQSTAGSCYTTSTMVEIDERDATHTHIEALISEFGSAEAAAQAVRSYDIKTPVTESNTPVLIAIDQLTKTYTLHRQKISALKNISMTIHEGEFVALTGPSGSGKSTLLQLIGGLDKPTTGTITIGNTNINKLRDTKLSAFRNQTIGFIFQFFYLQPFLKLSTNIEVPGMFAHSPRRERRAHARELLARVGLEEYADRLPRELSGGQIQRAAIARALLNSPKILLADEPTGNLDTKNSNEIISLFQDIQKELGTTIIIVTHNPDIAARTDREIRLRDGALV